MIFDMVSWPPLPALQQPTKVLGFGALEFLRFGWLSDMALGLQSLEFVKRFRLSGRVSDREPTCGRLPLTFVFHVLGMLIPRMAAALLESLHPKKGQHGHAGDRRLPWQQDLQRPEKAVSALGFWVKDLGYAGFGVNVEA